MLATTGAGAAAGLAWTSSFKIRPSLPLPFTCDKSILFSAAILAAAGIAAACVLAGSSALAGVAAGAVVAAAAAVSNFAIT